MQVFELHFNPKLKEDLIFDSFCYTPENNYEKRLGELYIVGELENALPQNSKLLQEISQVIKENYYRFPSKSPEKALTLALKKVNDFLAEKVKKDNVSWLGNLSFAVLSLKNFGLNFTRVGNLNIFLLRSGQVTNISKNLDFQEIEPYPLKIFSSVVSGKLAKHDTILILTKDIFNFFSSQNLIQEIAQKSFSIAAENNPKKSFDEKELEKILKPNEKELKNISGICLLILLRPALAKESKKSIVIQPKQRKFSILQTFLQTFSALPKKGSKKASKLRQLALKRTSKLRSILFVPPIKKSRQRRSGPKAAKVKISFSVPIIDKLLSLLKKKKVLIIKTIQGLAPKGKLKKNGILILFLISFLLAGFLFFGKERQKTIKLDKELLEQIQAKKNQAESFLIFQNEKEANVLFQEAWNELLPQIEGKESLPKEVQILKESIEENLFSLNKLEKIKEPELLVRIDKEKIKFTPQRILNLKSALYLFAPGSLNLYEFQIEEKSTSSADAPERRNEKTLEINWNLKQGAKTDEKIFFFSEPNILIAFAGPETSFQEKTFQLPSFDFNLDLFSTFNSNIYFLDTKSGEIIKYSNPLTKEIALPQLWLDEKTKKAIGAKSMVIDGSIWILTENNEIEQYYGGFYQETLKPNLFPYFRNPTKIWTSETSPYLYLLESEQNRIIILNKKGEIVKQFQSDKFDNLLDFAISKDSKIIYVLNGLRVYQIKF